MNKRGEKRNDIELTLSRERASHQQNNNGWQTATTKTEHRVQPFAIFFSRSSPLSCCVCVRFSLSCVLFRSSGSLKIRCLRARIFAHILSA